MRATRAWSRLVLCSLSLLTISRCASAEDGYGKLSGIIFEAEGIRAPLANITLVHQGSDFRRELVSDMTGKYELEHLPAGIYDVAAGSVRTGASSRLTVVVKDGQATELRIHLFIPTETSLSSGLRDIPLNGRNYLDLVADSSESIRGLVPSPRDDLSLSIMGQRPQNNTFLLDGMDNNDGWLGSTLLQPSLESIQSVILQEAYIPANIGHTSGGAVLVESRSGSGEFHGSIFGYFQDSALNARNFFDGANKPNLVQNQFGGSLGGPIRKKDWFFFIDTDLTRERRGLTVISTVPTFAEKSGDFGTTPIFDPSGTNQLNPTVFSRNPFPGNRIPLASISDAGRALVALYPDPNLPGTVNNYRFTPELIRNHQQFDTRTDKGFSPRNKLFARLSNESQDGQTPGELPGPFGTNTRIVAWGAAIGHTFVIGPSMVNQFRAGMTRFDSNSQAEDGMPVIRPSGYAQLGAAEYAPSQIRTTNYQVEDSVLWTTRRHSIRFGLQAIHRDADGAASEWSSRGTFFFTPDYTSLPGTSSTGDSIASLLTGNPSEVRRDVQLIPYRLRAWEWAGFVQDNIRVGRTITVQLGARYSLDPPVTEASDRMVNFDFTAGEPFTKFAGKDGVNRYAGLGYDHRTWVPRVGLVWDPSRKGSTVARVSFSKTYDPGAYFATGILARNEPFASRLDIVNSVFQTGFTLKDSLPAPAAVATLDVASLNSAHAPVYVIENGNYTPYTDQWAVSVQQRMQHGVALEASIISSMGIHLLGEYDSNQPTLAAFCNCFRHGFDPFISRVEYLNFAAGSTYYGGELKLTARQFRGLHVQSVYRYAKAIDDAAQPFTENPSRPSDPQSIFFQRGVRSPAPFDITHRLVVTAAYDLPWKLRIATVITAQTGFPFTPQLAINGLNNGGVQLPNRLGQGSLPSSQRSYLHWFNTSLNPADPNHAFEIPGNLQYGNSGYDILRGPGIFNADLSVARTFSFGDHARLETRAEAFNISNRTNFGLPQRLLGVGSSGAIDHTSTPSRQIQIVARVEW